MRYRYFLSMDVSRTWLGRTTHWYYWHSLGPGSFIEVRKILPLLVQADAEHPSFHVVALGLPGYGFSEAPKKPGFGIPQFAEVYTVVLGLSDDLQWHWHQTLQVGNKLMLALGYNEYGKEILFFESFRADIWIFLVTQGGDWGHRVRLNRALLFKKI